MAPSSFPERVEERPTNIFGKQNTGFFPDTHCGFQVPVRSASCQRCVGLVQAHLGGCLSRIPVRKSPVLSERIGAITLPSRARGSSPRSLLFAHSYRIVVFHTNPPLRSARLSRRNIWEKREDKTQYRRVGGRGSAGKS